MSANVIALQNAVNRIARMGRFERIDVDGGLGPKTNAGVFEALQWIAHNTKSNSTQTTAIGLISALIDMNGTINQAQIAHSASGLAIFINQAADEAGAPGENTQPTGSDSGAGATTPTEITTKTPDWATSLITKAKALPRWQQVALGLAAGLGAILVGKKIQQRNKLRTA